MAKRTGPRAELSLLMPLALLLLALISAFTLFAYRNTIELLLEERQAEAELLARHAAGQLAEKGWNAGEPARRLVPQAEDVVVYEGNVAPALPGAQVVVGEAAFRRGAQSFRVRVELAAGRLLARDAMLRVATPVLFVLDLAILILVLLSLRRLLQPLDRLLAHAQHLSLPRARSMEEEMALLVRAFEQAAIVPSPAGDDLSALERLLGRGLESGVLLLDRQKQAIGLNPAGAALLDLAPPGAATPLAGFLAAHPQLAAALEQGLSEPQGIQRQEIPIERRDGPRLLGLTLHPLRDDEQTIRGYLALFADLTEVAERERKERLAESLSQLGEMAGGVAHEMRNSLATVRGYLGLIERDPRGAAVPEHIAEIRRESDQLQQVLDDFLDFARPGNVRAEPVDLLELIERAAADPSLAGKRVAIETLGAEEDGIKPWRVAGDPLLLERAVRNVIRNAAEAEQRAGRGSHPLTLRLQRIEGAIELVVADRGDGVPAALRQRLFQPFATGRAGGVGLGLALTRRILLLHGGRIELDDRPGGGTEARLTVPVDQTVPIDKSATIGNGSLV
jgi:signal transduction histidine kinase